jgi:hypothetical protein
MPDCDPIERRRLAAVKLGLRQVHRTVELLESVVEQLEGGCRPLTSLFLAKATERLDDVTRALREAAGGAVGLGRLRADGRADDADGPLIAAYRTFCGRAVSVARVVDAALVAAGSGESAEAAIGEVVAALERQARELQAFKECLARQAANTN